jgi:uncharacterized protein YdhG (YjbR/CyaY superfamily)
MSKNPGYESIDRYIANQPEPVQLRLQQIRGVIQTAVPDATEAISYQIPTFKLDGNLVHFAAWKKHISIYPSSSTIEDALPDIARRSNGKGTIQFPHDEPLPIDLIRQFIDLRLSEFERQ